MPPPPPERPLLLRRLPLLLLLPLARAERCCSDVATQLHAGAPSAASVTDGSWTDFYFVAPSDSDNLVFEVEAESKLPTALGVYLHDGVLAASDTPASETCYLCNGETPLSDVAVMSVSAVRPSGAPPKTAVSLDMDTVSSIGNSTHRRYFVYVGQCYLMEGAVYYLSIYGQAASRVHFTVTAMTRPAALPITTKADLQVTHGTVCDSKYMHYYVDWPSLHPGGMEAVVTETSGELQAFHVRKEKCAGQPRDDLAAVNLFGYGMASGKVRVPGHNVVLERARYYVSVQGAPELCGNFTISIRNLTQHEFSVHS